MTGAYHDTPPSQIARRKAAPMNTIASFVDWLFGTRAGVLALIGIILVGFLIAAIILEHKTRETYDQYEDEEDDESGWSFFDDDNK